MVRVFIAIDLDSGPREAFSGVQEPLRRTGGRLSVVDPSLLHMTLKFLGEIPAAEIPRIIAALETIRSSPYKMRISGISSDNPRRPRVIWAEVHDGGASARLAHAIDSVLQPLGFPSETRPFRPHITLARVKEYHPGIPEMIASLSSFEGGEMEVLRILLKKSTLTPRGPIYETISEVRL